MSEVELKIKVRKVWFKNNNGERWEISNSKGEWENVTINYEDHSEVPILNRTTTFTKQDVGALKLTDPNLPNKDDYKPWTQDTCPLGEVVRNNCDGEFLITGKTKTGACIGLGWVAYEDIIAGYELKDGSFCGTKKEAE